MRPSSSSASPVDQSAAAARMRRKKDPPLSSLYSTSPFGGNDRAAAAALTPTPGASSSSSSSATLKARPGSAALRRIDRRRAPLSQELQEVSLSMSSQKQQQQHGHYHHEEVSPIVAGDESRNPHAHDVSAVSVSPALRLFDTTADDLPPLRITSSRHGGRPPSAGTARGGATSARASAAASSASHSSSLTAATECLQHLRTVVDSATAAALKLTVADQAYEPARRECAAAAVAAGIEGTENVLRLAAAAAAAATGEQQQQSAAASWSELLRLAADNVSASMSVLRGVIFPSAPPEEPPKAAAFESVATLTTERIKGLHRLMFSVGGGVEQHNHHHHSAPEVVLVEPSLHRVVDDHHHHNSPASLGGILHSAQQQQHQHVSSSPASCSSSLPGSARENTTTPAITSARDRSSGGGGGDLSARVQNMDRMLARLKTSSGGRLRSASTRNNPLSPWADAEDAIRVLQLRFVFEFWSYARRVEQQRRMNSWRTAQRIAKLRREATLRNALVQWQRALVHRSVNAAKHLQKENKQLQAERFDADEATAKAKNHLELAQMQLAAVTSEMKQRDSSSELVRCPMVVDFRKAIVNVVDGKPIESGIIEFQRAAAPIAETTTTTTATSSSSADSLMRGTLSSLYPPFVDHLCPATEFARALVRTSHIERMSEAGVAVPGYQPPKSYYQIRVSRGTAADVVATHSQASGTTVTASAESLRHLSDAFFSATATSFDLQACSLVNALLAKLQPMSATDWNTEENAVEQIYRRALAKELLTGKGSINMTSAKTTAQSRARRRSSTFGPTFLESEGSTTSSSSTSSDSEDNDDDARQQEQQKPAHNPSLRRASTALSSANAAFPGSSYRNVSPAVAAMEAVSASIGKARESFASLLEQLHGASEHFVSQSTERLLEAGDFDAALLRRKRDDVGHRDTSSKAARDDVNPFEKDGAAAVNRLCAVAPAPRTAQLAFKNNGLVIDSPKELIQRPEALVRALYVLFGEAAVATAIQEATKSGGGGFSAQASPTPTWAALAAMLLRTLPFAVSMSHTASFFETTDATNLASTSSASFSRAGSFLYRALSTVDASGAGGSTVGGTMAVQQLRHGRELAALLNAHVATAVATAECDSVSIRAAATDRLVLKRMTSALVGEDVGAK